MTIPLEELLKRLELLERRMARMEAALAASLPGQRALNTRAVRDATAAPAPSGVMPDPRVVAPLRAVVAAAPVPAPQGQPSTPPPDTTATPTSSDAPTVRLDAVPAPSQVSDGADPFPDLSLLDEKVEGKKGPAQRLDVRAALEDYPRICTRIEQLWGSPECEAYLNNLVIDTRGNRKGFPPAMMEELLYLGRLARALVILGVGGDLWDAYDQIGDRR